MTNIDRIKFGAYNLIEGGQRFLSKPQNRIALMIAIVALPTIACALSHGVHGLATAISTATQNPHLPLPADVSQNLVHIGHQNPLIISGQDHTCQITHISNLSSGNELNDGSIISMHCPGSDVQNVFQAAPDHIVANIRAPQVLADVPLHANAPQLGEISDTRVWNIPAGFKFDNTCNIQHLSGNPGLNDVNTTQSTIDLNGGNFSIMKVLVEDSQDALPGIPAQFVNIVPRWFPDANGHLIEIASPASALFQNIAGKAVFEGFIRNCDVFVK